MDDKQLRRIMHLRRCTRTIIDKLEFSPTFRSNARMFLSVGEEGLALEGIYLNLVRHPELHDLLDDSDQAFLRACLARSYGSGEPTEHEVDHGERNERLG
jgi:hypothetical protein